MQKEMSLNGFIADIVISLKNSVQEYMTCLDLEKVDISIYNITLFMHHPNCSIPIPTGMP